MRRLCQILGIWTLFNALPNPANAQSLSGLPVRYDSSSAPIEDETTIPFATPPAIPGESSCAINLEIGFPTGVRFQHALGEDVGRNWLVEGFAGLEVIFPMAGGGIRRRFTPVCGQHDALVLCPGLDGYVLYNTLHDLGWFGRSRTAFGMVSVDVDIFWHHVLSDHCASQFGIKLGAADAFGASEVIVPVVNLVFGLRF